MKLHCSNIIVNNKQKRKPDKLNRFTPHVVHRSVAVIVTALFLLTGCNILRHECLIWCHDSTEVQNDYVIARNECQNQAEQKLHLFTSQMRGDSPKERNSMLLALFAKCMHAKDWGVTAPKKEEKPKEQANNPPRPGTPWSPSPYAIQQAPVTTVPAPSATPIPQPQSYYSYSPSQALAPPQGSALAPSRPGTSWSPAPYGIMGPADRAPTQVPASPNAVNIMPPQSYANPGTTNNYYQQQRPTPVYGQPYGQTYLTPSSPYGMNYNTPRQGSYFSYQQPPVVPARPAIQFNPDDEAIPYFAPETPQDRSRAGVGLAPGY